MFFFLDVARFKQKHVTKYCRLLTAWTLLCLIFFESEKMRLGKTKTSFHYLGNLLSKTFNSKFTKVKLTIYTYKAYDNNVQTNSLYITCI
jgi:hypothetical protein